MTRLPDFNIESHSKFDYQAEPLLYTIKMDKRHESSQMFYIERAGQGLRYGLAPTLYKLT